MAIVAVCGFPNSWNLNNIVKLLARVIRGHFEALGIRTNRKNTRLCYLRLSPSLNGAQIVERINGSKFKYTTLRASIPHKLPKFPVNTGVKMPPNLMKQLKIPVEELPHQVLPIAHQEIMMELQSKYPGLYVISKKTSHKLLEEIGMKVLERVKIIMDSSKEASSSACNLTKCYRRMHPHFGDFQLVLSTLHSIQDAAGEPRDQIRESDLIAGSIHPYTIDNLPFDKVQQACNKYSERINKKVSEYVKNLKTDITADTPEENARKRVREELKKITPYLPMIIKQVIIKHFVPARSSFLRIRMYGEPFLPAREVLAPFLRSHRALRVFRSTRMYNLIKFDIPLPQYSAIRAMDGTVMSSAKLIIRSAETPVHKMSAQLRSEIWAIAGAPDDEEIPLEDQHDLKAIDDEEGSSEMLE